MNYIWLMNWFWEEVPYMAGYKPHYGIVFLAIVDGINSNDWKNADLEYDRMLKKTRCCKTTYYQARTWLSDNGLISFTSGKNEYSKATFELGTTVKAASQIWESDRKLLRKQIGSNSGNSESSFPSRFPNMGSTQEATWEEYNKPINLKPIKEEYILLLEKEQETNQNLLSLIESLNERIASLEDQKKYAPPKIPYPAPEMPEGAGSETDLKAKPKTSVFIPPTHEEVKTYFTDRTGVNGKISESFAEKFIAHYEEKGWRYGKTKMKDWKRAITAGWDLEEHIRKNKHLEPGKYYTGSKNSQTPSFNPDEHGIDPSHLPPAILNHLDDYNPDGTRKDGRLSGLHTMLMAKKMGEEADWIEQQAKLYPEKYERHPAFGLRLKPEFASDQA